ncbi:hypothetical protein PG999_014715 [Apiospora kogelbergensis]|uniref:Zn(2)-C6 fungal-type domain-containing protein n=1 Tax=Apiospora kogelbergensis TaxID=1337665 RepID=A0AAW0Q593_9PEZI
MPKAAKRSACDRCRAKRVRCPRAEASTAPCPRCVRIDVPCVTGSPGYPGRPRKSNPVDHGDMPGNSVMDADVEPSPVPSSVLQQDMGHLDLPTPPANGPLPANTSAPWLETDDSGRWVAPSETQLFDFASATGEDLASGSFPSLQLAQLSTLPEPQALLGASDNLDMTYLVSPSVSRPSAASLLRGFGETLERRTSTTKTFLSSPRNTIEKCPESSDSVETDSDNPVAAMLTCTKELTEIVQALTAESRFDASSASPDWRDHRLLPGATASPTRTASPITTETILLVLSSYLGLMELHELIFRSACELLNRTSPDAIRSLKVKAVLRIGGLPSLQDIPGSAYAQGLLEVFKDHTQTLERCLGLPPMYCLSCEGLPISHLPREDIKPRIEMMRGAMTRMEALFGIGNA